MATCSRALNLLGWAMLPASQRLSTNGSDFPNNLFAFLRSQAAMEAAFTGAGLQIDRVEATQDERSECPNAEVALGFTRQVGLVRLYLHGAPDGRVRALEQVFEERMREGFGQGGLDWSTGGRGINILAHRPD